MKQVCVALKAHMGWLNAVAVTSAAEPTPCWAQRLDLAAAEDRELTEPYHVAGGWHGLEQGPRPPDPAAIIHRGRRRQIQAAIVQLARLRDELEQHDLHWQRAVVLTGRGRTGTLEGILASHAQIHVAEGQAMRDAARAALHELAISCRDQDEKAVPEEVARRLARPDEDDWLKRRRPAEARAWRREERLLALAAWLNRD